MGRRRQTRSTPPKPFDAALARVSVLEKVVVHQMTPAPWGIHDVMRWLWDDRTVDTMAAAYKLSEPGVRRSSSWLEPVSFPNTGMRVAFYVDFDAAGMIQPKAALVSPNPARTEPIMYSLLYAFGLWKQFNEVRFVLNWLNDYATVGAARYYFPSVCGLLPSEHPVHDADGQRFRPTTANVGPIVPIMRRASVTVAGALLCNTDDPIPEQGLKFMFHAEDGMSSDIMSVNMVPSPST